MSIAQGTVARKSTPILSPLEDLSVRIATLDDLTALQQQWMDAQFSAGPLRPLATEIEKFRYYVAELKGEIVAGLLCVPMIQVVGGAEFAMAGIRAVTTSLHLRRRGIVNYLMRTVLHKLKKRYSLSALYPFSPHFYERYGYELCSNSTTWRFLLEDLKVRVPIEVPIRLTSAHLPLLLTLQKNEIFQLGNGEVFPNPYLIRQKFFPPSKKSRITNLGWLDDQGELLAVLSFNDTIEGGETEPNTLHIRAIHGVDRIWREKALAFLTTLTDQYIDAELRVESNPLFFHSLKRPRYWESIVRREGSRLRGATYELRWQARILDAPTAFSTRRMLHGVGGEMVVHLSDPVFTQQNATFFWRISAEDPVFRPATADEISTLPQLTVSIGDLSRIWYGAANPYELREAGRMSCPESAAQILNGAFGGFRCSMSLDF